MKIDLKDCYIYFRDGTPTTPKQITVKIGTGNVTFTEHFAREYALDRGKLDTVRNGDEAPVDVSMEFSWEWLGGVSTTVPTPVEVLKKIGAAADWITSDDDTCAPFAVDIIIDHNPYCSDGTLKELTTLPDFRVEELAYNIKDGQISCTGKCNTTVVINERVAQTATATT
jgi:hypothetical protein